MIESLAQLPIRRTLFMAFVLFAFAVSAVHIVVEIFDGEPLSDMFDDVMRFIFSAVLLAILISERLVRQRKPADLKGQLERARGQFAKTDVQSVKLASQYRAVIQKPFYAWRLSAREQDVVIEMLKSLSFREIAELRGTREQTVRQQASTVHRKAGVGGRNELTAWFFKDVLEPPTDRLQGAAQLGTGDFGADRCDSAPTREALLSTAVAMSAGHSGETHLL